MPYKDPEKQRAYQRELMRRRRSQATVGKQLDTARSGKWRTFRLQTAEDLRVLIEQMTELLINADIDLSVKAMRINQLSATAIKLLELAEQERRLAAIEATVEEK